MMGRGSLWRGEVGTALRILAIVSLVGSLPACAERISFGGLGSSSNSPSTQPERLPAAPTGPVTISPLASPGTGGPRPPPPVNMAGRWTLTAPGTGGCAMNFGATPGAAEGTIAPEGGCPGNFFTSRKWVFE